MPFFASQTPCAFLACQKATAITSSDQPHKRPTEFSSCNLFIVKWPGLFGRSLFRKREESNTSFRQPWTGSPRTLRSSNQFQIYRFLEVSTIRCLSPPLPFLYKTPRDLLKTPHGLFCARCSFFFSFWITYTKWNQMKSWKETMSSRPVWRNSTDS